MHRSQATLDLLLSSPRIPPHQPTRVTTQAKEGAVDVEDINLSAAGTPGGTADWVVNDIEVDGRSQLAYKDLPGALFGIKGVALVRGQTLFTVRGFDIVERGHEFALVVTYVGPNPEGAPFFCGATGSRPLQRPTVVPIASKGPLPRTTQTTISARIQNAPFQIERFEIDEPAEHWIINVLRVNGTSQLRRTGDIPGSLFSTNMIASSYAVFKTVLFETCQSGNTIEIDMTYIGLNESGGTFTGRFEGTVVRDDLSTPPPDLHVLIETSGQDSGDAVVATCNWRAPATDNRPS